MTLRLQHVDGEYELVLTPEQVASLHVAEGDELEFVPVRDGGPSVERRGVQYASMAEVMESHRRTEPLFEHAYQELAK